MRKENKIEMDKKITTIRLPDELKEKLVKNADSMGISLNALIIV